ncbi:urate oxidase [Dictyostelium discoideum AX4]|uniref:Uricase n=1 Tax=Dictyostelium discoideum TaxID=44689 RepID=URIC_DICDI|nr:urate oxidase [Dictyostelium discoideum AX4]Q54LT2.1 RecName: Full=Uricase; AltName: Full=Urate oxidase [Dictyostelium discoideum]EAL64238.1 urate oxidase [Dictyostelium discoideum AX4]|eukprot:XP_637748.1 urate oxidase [Dictyostelium discoideum AX4]
MATLIDNRYGKARVRVLRVFKGPNEYHKVFDFDCRVLLRGAEFSETYLTGDNSKVVATDTMKNTVYVIAQKEEFKSLEEYGILLGKHFLATYSWVNGVEVVMRENQWRRIKTSNGKEQAHSFQRDREIHSVTVTSSRDKSPVVVSGIDDLLIMKTTQSGFEGFHRDKYTSLKETKDRVFATVVTANWTYNTLSVDYSKVFEQFKLSVFDIFAQTYSRSVQETLFLIAKDVISKVPQVEQVHLSLPNKHAFGFDFSRLNIENNQTVFQPVEEPSGLIEGTIKRSHSRL